MTRIKLIDTDLFHLFSIRPTFLFYLFYLYLFFYFFCKMIYTDFFLSVFIRQICFIGISILHTLFRKNYTDFFLICFYPPNLFHWYIYPSYSFQKKNTLIFSLSVFIRLICVIRVSILIFFAKKPRCYQRNQSTQQ